MEVAKCCVVSTPSALKNSGCCLRRARLPADFALPSESVEGVVKPVSEKKKSSFLSSS